MLQGDAPHQLAGDGRDRERLAMTRLEHRGGILGGQDVRELVRLPELGWGR